LTNPVESAIIQSERGKENLTNQKGKKIMWSIEIRKIDGEWADTELILWKGLPENYEPPKGWKVIAIDYED